MKFNISLDELEINDSLYTRFFEEYMHMIKDRKYTSDKGFMLVTFESFCDTTTYLRLPDPPVRHSSMYGFGLETLKLMPGVTENEIRHTKVFEDVTCPHCYDGYVLSMLGDLP